MLKLGTQIAQMEQGDQRVGIGGLGIQAITITQNQDVMVVVNLEPVQYGAPRRFTFAKGDHNILASRRIIGLAHCRNRQRRDHGHLRTGGQVVIKFGDHQRRAAIPTQD